MKKDARVDAYIEKSAGFARPVLKALRSAIHEACPDVEEKVRWGMPSFDVNGGPVCQLAAFKAHCRFIFWNTGGMANTPDDMFGHITSEKDLPSKKAIVAIVKKAAAARARKTKEKANEKKSPMPKRAAKPMPKMPADLGAALAKDKKAKAAFDAFSPSHKREYIEWITDAKHEATRTARIQKAIAQCAQKKSLNWKYA